MDARAGSMLSIINENRVDVTALTAKLLQAYAWVIHACCSRWRIRPSEYHSDIHPLMTSQTSSRPSARKKTLAQGLKRLKWTIQAANLLPSMDCCSRRLATWTAQTCWAHKSPKKPMKPCAIATSPGFKSKWASGGKPKGIRLSPRLPGAACPRPTAHVGSDSPQKRARHAISEPVGRGKSSEEHPNARE